MVGELCIINLEINRIIAPCTLIVMGLILIVATLTTISGGYFLGCTITLEMILKHPIAFLGACLILGLIVAFL